MNDETIKLHLTIAQTISLGKDIGAISPSVTLERSFPADKPVAECYQQLRRELAPSFWHEVLLAIMDVKERMETGNGLVGVSQQALKKVRQFQSAVQNQVNNNPIVDNPH